MDTADGLPFFGLLRNGDHILLPFCNVSTILLRKTSSRENIRPPENPFLVSSYSVIKFLVSGNRHLPFTIYHSPYSEGGKSKLLQVAKKSGHLFCRLQVMRIFILRPRTRKALCCVLFCCGRRCFPARQSGTTAVKIIQDIHKVYIRVVRRVIRIKILMHIAVSKIFCAHIIKMVRCL